MIYFDNAATSRFKPKSVRKAVVKELKKSANPGRGAHRDAIRASMLVENARAYLLSALGADDDYELVFTKNCTEALNLAIFGTVIPKTHVVTTALEHNSVLRPLFKLKDENVISLSVLNPDRFGKINPAHFERMLGNDTRLAVVTAQSNVTGMTTDLAAIGKICAGHNVTLLADGAQAVPLTKINVKEMNISMLAAPGHKGLHGPQGTGFLIFKRNLNVRPLLLGGTGTDSDSVYMPKSPPESLEAGTLNAAGIAGLLEGAKWSFKHAEASRKHIEKLSEKIIYGLKKIPGVTLYTADDCFTGVVSFNVKGADSTEVGDILNEKYHVAVRAGLHCAPLVHNANGTLDVGAVRVGIGVDNTEKEADKLLSAVKSIAAKFR